MTAPIALQLYTLRAQLPEDYAGVIRQVAAMGYAGVEPAGFPGSNVRDAARLFGELGLAVPAAHVNVFADANAAFETTAALECGYAVSGGGLGRDNFKTLDDVRRACDRANVLALTAKANGVHLGLHNHWWEFEPVEGQIPFDIMLERLDDSIIFEVDCYWAQVAGADPVAVIQRLGTRAPLLHIKDGPVQKDVPQTAVGQGKMDYQRIIAAAPHAEWLIVELDNCATHMLTAVSESYDYLVSSSLAAGKG